MPVSIRNTISKAWPSRKEQTLYWLSSKWKDIPTPYVVTDISQVKKNVKRFNSLLPGVQIFYALKANADQKVIDGVDRIVTGYDIASAGELDILLEKDVDVRRVMYSNPVKIPDHIKKAYDKGVRYFALDSVTEISKLTTYAPGSNVYLRLKVSDYGSKFPLSKKFGVDQAHASELCSLAQDMGLNVKGVTFHVGSQSENLQTWRTALEIAGNTIQKLRAKGIAIEFINLGGGFPADYGEPVPSIEEVAQVIKHGLASYMPDDIRVFAEPGRCIVADSSSMVASIIGIEHRSGSDWIYLDVGTFQGLIEPLEIKDWHYPIYTDKHPKSYKKNFVLSGPTCDAYDTLGDDYLLPSDLNVGDKICIGAVGAYSLVYASNFNGFQPPKVYYVNE